jgi:excinuclease ABC subunit C
MDIKPFLKSLPNLPGVYRMINQAGEVIYVGKAKDLKKRVSSYFVKTIVSPRTKMMVGHIDHIEITVTHSEAEALILENNMIKSHMPRYNVIFRDDKSYPYIVLTGEKFPRLAFHRGTQKKGNQYFGPFPNTNAVRESIQLLQKVFKLRTCENSVFKNRSRPCLQYQIHRCTAPCVDLIKEDEYKNDIKHASLFLDGKDSEVISQLTYQMNEAASSHAYEYAALYRDRIQSLRQVRTKQFVSDFSASDADIIACVEEAGEYCLNLVMIRAGRHLGDKSFFPKNAADIETQDVIETFVAQYYTNQTIPKLIVTQQYVNQSLLSEFFKLNYDIEVKVINKAIGDKRVWLAMAQKNAQIALKQKLMQSETQENRVEALKAIFNLSESFSRIECFDISHTMGEGTVASCVVFDKGNLQNKEYRRFNIEDITPGDDYGAMREVLTRRYKKIATGEGIKPDLIFIDGGKGQLNIAIEVIQELGLSDILLVGIAKGEGRKPGLEQLFVEGKDEPIIVKKDNVGFHLIQQIRDEAHRFAISGHRAKRAKKRITSSLEDIEGIGAQKRKNLLVYFGGIERIKNASIEEIIMVNGIDKKLAEKIFDYFH